MAERWRVAPPKEGRPRSLALLFNTRRRTSLLRLVLVLSVLGVIYLTFSPSSLSTSPDLAKIHINERSDLREPVAVEASQSHQSPLLEKLDDEAQRPISGDGLRTNELGKAETPDQQPLDETIPGKQDKEVEAQTSKTSLIRNWKQHSLASYHYCPTSSRYAGFYRPSTRLANRGYEKWA
jgi:hypothetical protein